MKNTENPVRPFLLNEKVIKLAPSQKLIFDYIASIGHPRVHVIAPTQYGKSLAVALGVLIRAVFFNERWIVLAPSDKKTQIIMGYIIEHTFDDPLILGRLELDKGASLDRLRRERSRNNLTFIGGGGVMTLTLDSRNSKRSFEAAMGFGGNRLILDESALIDDTLYATVKRMLGGFPYKDTFLMEIGNPFFRNHFYTTSMDPSYHHVRIDYHIGLKEKRYSPQFIEEMRKLAYFDVFYECKFPTADMVDSRGYRQVFPYDLLESSFVNASDASIDPNDVLSLGIDVGGGSANNTYILRTPYLMWIEGSDHSSDTMTTVSTTQEIMVKRPALKDRDIFIDDIGVGRGPSDRMIELGLRINQISVGEPPLDKTKFINIKAENYWEMMQWLKDGGKIIRDERWLELGEIKYKISTDRVIQIEPKEDLIKRVGRSPDFAEGGMLTFSLVKEKGQVKEVKSFGSLYEPGSVKINDEE